MHDGFWWKNVKERKKPPEGLGVVGKVIFKSLHGTRRDLNRIHKARGIDR
jgi:hypothetical protein